jgi:hypothetical protein
MRASHVVAIAVVSLFVAVGSARADRFRPVPDGAGLELRVVGYDGGVNGQLTVELRNPGTAPVRFVAEGMYFVPRGDADVAPQRLGAVGLVKVVGDREAVHRRGVDVPPGVVARVQLEVFCIDSERDSPTSSTRFVMAGKRMPVALGAAITADARKAVKAHGGIDNAAGRQAVQRAVWTARELRWFALQGDGRQEVTLRRGGK